MQASAARGQRGHSSISRLLFLSLSVRRAGGACACCATASQKRRERDARRPHPFDRPTIR